MRHNEANNMTLLIPYYMLHFQILDKIDSFLKNVSDVVESKKEEPPNLHIISVLVFFLFRCGFQEKIP